MAQLRRDLPPAYHSQLPLVAPPGARATARIHLLAVELLRHSDARLDVQRLERFLAGVPGRDAAQHRRDLGLAERAQGRPDREHAAPDRRGAGEPRRPSARQRVRRPARSPGQRRPTSGRCLASCRRHSWSSCSRACASSARAPGSCERASRSACARRGSTVEDLIRAEQQAEAAAQVSLANTVTSLRLCASHDWSRSVERVSLVEQILQRDPAGVYGRMDFASRDRYRQAIEELAEPSGEAQVEAALAATEQARAAHEQGADNRVGARRLSPDRRRPARARAARGVPPRRAPAPAARGLPPRHGRLPRRSRARDRGRGRRGRVGRPRARRLAAGPGRARPARALARERPRHERRAAAGGGAREAAPAAAARPRVGRARAGRDDGGDPDTARERCGRARARRAPRGAGARKPRSSDPLRDPRRLRGRGDGGAERRRGDPGGGDLGDRSARQAARRRPLLPVPSRAPLQPERGLLHGLGAQARQARRVRAPAARRAGHELQRHARGPLGAAPRPLPDLARPRHAPAPRRGAPAARHRGAPAEPRALRPAAAPRHRGLRHPAAARQRHVRERRRLALRPDLRGPHGRRPLHDRGLGHLPGPVRRGHLHGQGPDRR